MKNKDLIKKLQELDPEAYVALHCMEDYSLLYEIYIEEAGIKGRGESIASIYNIPEDKKMIVLSNGC